MIETIQIADPHHLIVSLNELSNSYIFRGHADSRWRLQSTLERTAGTKFDDAFVELWEQSSRSNFEAKFHIYDTQNQAPTTKLGWLSLMQHYGVPTRLLDFTQSPYIALYFAIESYEPHAANSFAVYAIDYGSLQRISIEEIRKVDRTFRDDNNSIALEGRQDKVFEDVVDRFSYPILWVTEPSKLNVRIDRQAGCFLMTGKKSLSIEAALGLPAYVGVTMKKFEIPGEFFQNAYALLRKMNISATTIYGDLAGLASSLRAEARVRSWP